MRVLRGFFFIFYFYFLKFISYVCCRREGEKNWQLCIVHMPKSKCILNNTLGIGNFSKGMEGKGGGGREGGGLYLRKEKVTKELNVELVC